MVKNVGPHSTLSKRKAISALFPYVFCLGQGQGMVDVISRAAMASNSAAFVWDRIRRYITTLFDTPRPSSLNLVITHMPPYVPWVDTRDSENAVARWATVVLAVQHTEEVGWSVVDALLQIASDSSLRPHIPIELWARIKNQQSLPPCCLGRSWGTRSHIVRFVRGLEDIELLKPYLLLVWSEWDWVYAPALNEMVASIRKDFMGIEMRHHREHLIERLDHVLRQLSRGLGYLRQHKREIDEGQIRLAKEQYRRLKKVLLEINGIYINTPTT